MDSQPLTPVSQGYVPACPDVGFQAACDTVQQLRAEVDVFSTAIADEDAFHEVVQRLDKATLALAATPAPTFLDLRRQAQLIQREVGTSDFEPALAFLKQLAAGPVAPAATPAVSSPDAALIAECDQLMSLEEEAKREADRLKSASDEDWHAVIDPIWARRSQVVDRIETMLATTPAGVLALIKALDVHNSIDPESDSRPYSYEGGLTGRLLETALQSAGKISTAASPPLNPDAEYIALCDQVVQSEAEWRSTGLHQDTLPQAEQREYEQTVREAISERSSELFDRLLQLTPQTPEGQKAAAQATLAFMPCHDDGTPDIDVIHDGENLAWMLVKQLAGVAIPVPPNPDADLKAACNELIALIDRMNVEAGDKDITNDDPRYVQQEGLAERILAQVPRTLDGHQLRAQAILAWHGGMDGNGRPASELHQDDFWQVIRDLIGASTIEAMSKRTAAICAGYPDVVPA